MKVRSIIVWSLLLVPALVAGGAEGGDGRGRRYAEKSGKFSYAPPENWRMSAVPGLKYEIAIGPTRDGFASNITVVDEEFNGSLDDYVKSNVEALKANFKGLTLEVPGKFRTKDGVQGVRLISESEQAGRRLRQGFYFFETGSTKYVVCCSTLADGGEKLDPVFEKALKSFRLGK
jgi:hypothetical protein